MNDHHLDFVSLWWCCHFLETVFHGTDPLKYLCCFSLGEQKLLTAILAWKSAVGTMGMGPPCFPNFLSKLSCTDTGGRKQGKKKDEWISFRAFKNAFITRRHVKAWKVEMTKDAAFIPGKKTKTEEFFTCFTVETFVPHCSLWNQKSIQRLVTFSLGWQTWIKMRHGDTKWNIWSPNPGLHFYL